MCDLYFRAAKLRRAPWSGNKKDENAVHTICGWSRQNPAGHLQTTYQHASAYNCGLHKAQESRQNKQGQRAQPQRCISPLGRPVFNATAPKQPIVSVPHHRQAAHPNSSSKAHEILTKRSCTSKLLTYMLNSVGLHYVMVHSSSSYLSASLPCP